MTTQATKKNKSKPEGTLRSVQFDKNGTPIYIITAKGIYRATYEQLQEVEGLGNVIG